jgi:hypothetical protein
MGEEKSIVITAYGHNRVIDKISVSLFDKSASGHGYNDDSAAKIYCNNINSLELPEETWVSAKIVAENTQYALDEFLPIKFDILLKLDDMAIQRILRGCETPDIARALKGENEAIQSRIFNNMSKRAVIMLKEDMDIGQIRIQDVKKAQEKILSLICQLENRGEIIIQYSKGEIVK